ncbi:MAG: replicative DNA helicase, partial [Gemmatimonadota bacterium]|nr:replicative DNA helicase [Gemmatimonadota bacterium]
MASQNPTLNTAERALPQALEVERAVLGAMLIDNMAINRVVEVLGDETAFYHTPHRKVYAAIQKLSERGDPVDQVTLTAELVRRGQLDDVGGVVFIAELASEMATAANAEYHAQIVLEKAQRRRLIDAATQTLTESYEETEDVRELIDRAEQRVFQIAEGELGKGVMPLSSAIEEAYVAIERAHEQPGALTGVTTGYTDLDEITAGLLMNSTPSFQRTVALSTA